MAKGAWTYDSYANKGPEIRWQLVLHPCPKELTLPREKQSSAGQILVQWAQEQQRLLCSFRSQGSILQACARWIPVLFKGSSAQTKQSVIRPLFVSYLQGFDVLSCLSDCHRACYYPFPTSFFSFTVSSLMVKWPSLDFFFPFPWATMFTLVKSFIPEAQRHDLLWFLTISEDWTALVW